MIKIGFENTKQSQISTYFFIIYNVKAKAVYYINPVSLYRVSADLLDNINNIKTLIK